VQIIKQLRQNMGISQTDLANALKVSLRTIQLYEKKDANIPMKNLNKIAAYFDLSIADLYFKELKEPDEPYLKGIKRFHHGTIMHVLPNGKILLSAPLLFLSQQENFINADANIAQLNNLTYIDFLLDSFVDVPHIAFEILGDAMNDGSIHSISNGNVVLGQKCELDDMAKAIPNKNSFVIVTKQRIHCKSVTAISQKAQRILCHNLNPSPEYQDFEIVLDEVLAIYQVIKKQF